MIVKIHPFTSEACYYREKIFLFLFILFLFLLFVCWFVCQDTTMAKITKIIPCMVLYFTMIKEQGGAILAVPKRLDV